MILVVHADPPESFGRVDVRSGADDLIRAEVAGLLDVAPDDVHVGRLCPRCGSAGHGRPRVTGAYAANAPHVSISRAGGRVVVALTHQGPVGVDAVALADLTDDAAPRTAAALGLPDDTAVRTVAEQWSLAEAVLKATGQGLSVDPSESREVVGVRASPVDLGPGLVAHVAVATTTPLEQVVVRAARAAPRDEATRRTPR